MQLELNLLNGFGDEFLINFNFFIISLIIINF